MTHEDQENSDVLGGSKSLTYVSDKRKVQESEEEEDETDGSSSFFPSGLSDNLDKDKDKDKIRKGIRKTNKKGEKGEKEIIRSRKKGIAEKEKIATNKELNKKMQNKLGKGTGMTRTGAPTAAVPDYTVSYKNLVSNKESGIVNQYQEVQTDANNEKYILKKKKLDILINKNVKNEHGVTGGAPLRSAQGQIFENKDGLYMKESTERLIHLYKEEKQMKLDIYKNMSYEAISCFQLKKAFLLDMSEHIYFARFVNGHIIKILDPRNLIKVEDFLKDKKMNGNVYVNETTNVTRKERDQKNINDVGHIMHWKNEEQKEKERRKGESEVDGIDALDKKKNYEYKNHANINNNAIRNTTDNDVLSENRHRIFFITNIVKSDNYFCVDRYVNIKFEITHFENIKHTHFIDYLKDAMIKNKKIASSMLEVSSYEKYICSMEDISNSNISIDEYNYIKLYLEDVDALKHFFLFIREKIEDLKKFHYTEKQIQELVERKKRKNLNELFMNNKNIESLSISRVTIQNEICSLLREIDTLNYSKRHIKKEDRKSLKAIDWQIEQMTKKIEKFRELLEQLRTQRIHSHTQDKDKDEIQQRDHLKEKEEKSLKEKLLNDYITHPSGEKYLFTKRLENDEKKIAQLSNHINAENNNFHNCLSKKLDAIPIETHQKICTHFLLAGLQHDSYMSECEDKNEEEKNPFEIFGIPLNEYVMTLDDVKKHYYA